MGRWGLQQRQGGRVAAFVIYPQFSGPAGIETGDDDGCGIRRVSISLSILQLAEIKFFAA
jgi:hypothetical protein